MSGRASGTVPVSRPGPARAERQSAVRDPAAWLSIRPVIAALLAALLTVGAQQAGQILRGRDPLLFLRTAFWHDQLGYLAIVADARNGQFSQTEPVTMTGANYYPRFYYSIVGFVARSLGLESVVAWNAVSLVLQFAAAFALGLTAARLSRRWWMALFAPVPFFTGTFAYLADGNPWYTSLQAHAVLWGPFGALFSNNAETAGLCTGIIAVCALTTVWSSTGSSRVRVVVTIAAAAVVGVLSSFQTYSFLSAVYLLAFGAATAGILSSSRRVVLTVMTVALFAVVFTLGPIAADAVGQLPTLVFGLLPAAPGLVTAIARTRGLVALAAAAAVATAAPQVCYTAWGILSDDPFLTYRVASNVELGVVEPQALWSAAAVLVALIGTTILGVMQRDRLIQVIAVTGLVTLPYLALNDLWGANAEPYRFWIEGLLFGGVLAALGLARALGTAFPIRGLRPAIAFDPARRRTTAVVLVVSGLVWLASVPDWVLSLQDGNMQAVWNPATAREQAIAALAHEAGVDAGTGLLTTEPCIDTRTTKANSGAPVANYHLGMAWPADREAIDDIVAARGEGRLDLDAMERTDTTWLLTDSLCTTGWAERYGSHLTPVGERTYVVSPGEVVGDSTSGDGIVRLWRVEP